eukprot:12209314-Alexandrium_andersonii.AAC.1
MCIRDSARTSRSSRSLPSRASGGRCTAPAGPLRWMSRSAARGERSRLSRRRTTSSISPATSGASTGMRERLSRAG